MSAREDYPLRRHGEVPKTGHIIDTSTYERMCDEIDMLRDRAFGVQEEFVLPDWVQPTIDYVKELLTLLEQGGKDAEVSSDQAD